MASNEERVSRLLDVAPPVPPMDRDARLRHQQAVLAGTHPTRGTRGPGRTLLVALVVSAVSLGGVAGAYYWPEAASVTDQVGCYGYVDDRLDLRIAVVERGAEDPSTTCLTIWLEGSMGDDPVPSSFVECITDAGGLAIVPDRGSDECAVLDMQAVDGSGSPEGSEPAGMD